MGFGRVNEVETAGLRAAPQEKIALTWFLSEPFADTETLEVHGGRPLFSNCSRVITSLIFNCQLN